ncbi:MULTISPECIES: DUF4926 domain-containing protein [Methylobacterium]|uniref:DUF4926 domain-containing protein n=1 Tax=Methylobacterium thuringiense TaxID=1003091 RepID=A0ABQ4TL76_9HYPH|nr:MULTISPECIES: DUF4926 domain-containing protein [Methylobacterium]GJE55599.1 hypothetical protein EKPJFOCH_2093 [Methylobacterium thuringiense]
MSYETMHQFQDPHPNHPLFAELSVVETLRPVETDDGRPVPAGSRGTIVAVYGGGKAYEVEFARPVVGNCTLRADALQAV